MAVVYNARLGDFRLEEEKEKIKDKVENLPEFKNALKYVPDIELKKLINSKTNIFKYIDNPSDDIITTAIHSLPLESVLPFINKDVSTTIQELVFDNLSPIDIGLFNHVNIDKEIYINWIYRFIPNRFINVKSVPESCKTSDVFFTIINHASYRNKNMSEDIVHLTRDNILDIIQNDLTNQSVLVFLKNYFENDEEISIFLKLKYGDIFKKIEEKEEEAKRKQKEILEKLKQDKNIIDKISTKNPWNFWSDSNFNSLDDDWLKAILSRAIKK